MVMVFGEITTKANVDYEKVVRQVCRDVGFISDDVSNASQDTYDSLHHSTSHAGSFTSFLLFLV